MTRLLIFDADDTLRRTRVPGRPCPRAPGEWELLPNVAETLARIDWTSVRLGIASNQDQIGYGLIRPDVAEQLFSDLVLAATADAVRDPVIRCCPHRLDVACNCRKPQPGMLIDIMRVTGTQAFDTLFVGNAETDREAARRAGCHFRWAAEFFRPGEGSPPSD
jgi:D-glycero-D-manno-heptose 1,7-bisphosphate phosphatase